jgi:hypothetical protein
LRPARAASRASFFAHPEPLNTIAGVDISLRMLPPHTAQAEGPSAVTERSTSMRSPQLVQA